MGTPKETSLPIFSMDLDFLRLPLHTTQILRFSGDYESRLKAFEHDC
jgi:hypothetical protein